MLLDCLKGLEVDRKVLPSPGGLPLTPLQQGLQRGKLPVLLVRLGFVILALHSATVHNENV